MAGPILVVAGAGTGKTRVITERIKHLIKKHKVSPNEILAVTFTDKASSEMLNRLDDVMPLGYEEPWIYTFHSFADRILKKEGIEIGLDPSYKILSYPDQWLLLRKHIFDFNLDYFRPLGNPTKFISAILKFISRLQDESISVEDFKSFANEFNEDPDEKKRYTELAYIYEEYEKLKLLQSKLDFGDLILWTIKLFRQRPNILKKYIKQFKHILVDEFQDTNYAQYELIKLLASSDMLANRSLMVVGDDSQSIYKFRGAAVSNILGFIHDYKNAEMVTLLQNYRSTQNILDPAYTLIKNNNPDTLESKLNISKELISEVSFKSNDPEIVCSDTVENEVDYVVAKIVELLGVEPDYTYKDFAILARANNHLDPFVFALRKHGLPYQLVGNRGLYDRDEVRDILSLLRVIINPKDSLSLYRSLNMKVFDIDTSIISQILSNTKFKKTDMWDVILSQDAESVILFVEKITSYQKVITTKTPVEFVYELVHEINYLKHFLDQESIENQLCINNLNLFLNRIKKFEVDFRSETKEVPTIVDFVDFIELMIEAGENPAQAEIQDIDTINLLTVHASKGLEFGCVFMVNLVSGRFPTRNRKDVIDIPDELIKETLPTGDEHIQEERRLFYVGMTRAQKYLYLTYAKNYGGKQEKRPSGYLNETKLATFEANINTLLSNKQSGLFGVLTDFRNPVIQKSSTHVPYSLSFSKISDYKMCPLKYKYRYVLEIPTPPSHALSFGTTIHDTLRDYHAKLLADVKVSLDELLAIYKKNWQPLGYMDKKHQQLYFDNGENLLKRYFEENLKQKIIPVDLEKSFTLNIAGIKFFGRIDRIDPLEDGVEIIDYKTGSPKSQKEVDADDQVAFYAIAAKEALGLQPNKLTYYFLESGEKISTTRTQEELAEKKIEVAKVVTEMKEGKFEATPGMHCTWCDYKDICPFAYKG